MEYHKINQTFFKIVQWRRRKLEEDILKGVGEEKISIGIVRK